MAYRVILRVRGMVPGSLPASFSPRPNHGTTAALLQTLYGTMPAAAKILRVKNAPAYSYTHAWTMNGDLWVRTHGRLLAPAWIATEASANGVHAYVLPQTHAILLRFDGMLYRKLVVSAADIERALFLSTPTANALIRDFERLGMLQEITGQQRGRAYAFERYLRLFVS